MVFSLFSVSLTHLNKTLEGIKTLDFSGFKFNIRLLEYFIIIIYWLFNLTEQESKFPEI